ncbi:MAG: glycosyltransferase [Planctomycetes bacterium]|nr:glycosyltransferase [Planctomycetota bacterium]
MSEQHPIVILTASAGAGHVVAAAALRDAFAARVPQVPVEIHDVLAASNAFFRQLYAGGYLVLANHAPTLMGMLFEATDRPGRGIGESLRVAFQNLHVRPTMRYLQRRHPRLIVNTHFLPAEIVAQLRRAGRLDCPQVTVVTDYESHRIWVHPPTERYYTASEVAKQYLTTWEVPGESVLVTGIPVRAAFTEHQECRELRRRLRLEPEQPVVLLLCGGEGIGPTETLLQELLTIRAPVQLVVIAGRDEKRRRRLEAVAGRSGRPARVVGFTDDMHEWMRAADLVVSKPGGLTVSESFVCGLPMVVVNPIPGQESRNSDYLLEHGAGIKVNNPRVLGQRVTELLAAPARLQTLRKAALALAKPNAAGDIVADALRLTRPTRN